MELINNNIAKAHGGVSVFGGVVNVHVKETIYTKK
jgi:F0F1-type ATP synthase beta subunit